MKQLFVIHEKNLQDGETDILGVADSMDNVEVMLKKYYGNYTDETPFEDIWDGMLLWKVINVKDRDKEFRYRINVRWFAINEI